MRNFKKRSEGERFVDVDSGSPSLERFEVAHAETVVRLREALDTPYGLQVPSTKFQTGSNQKRLKRNP